MRLASGIIAILLLLTGCSSRDCLPEPANDPSPPAIRIVIHFTPPGSSTQTTHRITDADSSAVVSASRSRPVVIEFVATDSSGLRRLAPAVTAQHTVGVGVERQFVPIDEVRPPCPVAALRVEHEALTSGDRRVLIASAVAENWAGGRTVVEPITIRME